MSLFQPKTLPPGPPAPYKVPQKSITHYATATDVDYWKKELFRSTITRPGEVWPWAPTDSKEKFDQTTDEFRAKGLEFYWKADSFNYVHNMHGFRGPNFNTKADFKILVSGCSFTYGIGLPYDMVWPELLAKKIPGAVAYNLAQGGHSLDYVVRSIYKTIDIIKPDLIAILVPPSRRYEFIQYNQVAPYGPHSSDFAEIFLNDEYINYLVQKNLAFLQTICLESGVKLLLLDSNSPEIGLNATPNPQYPIARDNGHPGPAWQESVANLFYEKYQQC